MKIIFHIGQRIGIIRRSPVEVAAPPHWGASYPTIHGLHSHWASEFVFRILSSLFHISKGQAAHLLFRSLHHENALARVILDLVNKVCGKSHADDAISSVGLERILIERRTIVGTAVHKKSPALIWLSQYKPPECSFIALTLLDCAAWGQIV
jgi:hypothetical protein